MASHSPQRPRRLQTQQLNQGMSSFINMTLSSLLERFFVHGLTSGALIHFDLPFLISLISAANTY